MKIVFTSDTHAGFSAVTERKHVQKFLPSVAEEKPDLVIHAGGWGTNQPKHVERTFRQFRDALGDILVVGVLGNHDFWDHKKEFKTFADLHYKIQEWAKAYKITLLDGDSVCVNGIGIFGFTGWYGSTPFGTNDKLDITSWVDADAHLREKARENYQKALSSTDQICITHFPPYSINPRWAGFCANQMYFDPLCSHFKYLLCGHNHQNESFYHLGCRVMTCGSDYDQPKYKIIEFEEEEYLP